MLRTSESGIPLLILTQSIPSLIERNIPFPQVPARIPPLLSKAIHLIHDALVSPVSCQESCEYIRHGKKTKNPIVRIENNFSPITKSPLILVKGQLQLAPTILRIPQ